MRLSQYTLFLCWCLFLCLAVQPLNAQLGFDLDIKKPEAYEKRELRAEKSGQKKFTLKRRLFQNTFTHYNYFFNANNRLNEIIDRAKASYHDDYSTLLPFYNYSLASTTLDKSELDSVIYKSKTGIVMHDLRNDWIDDLYLLWGASYYLQQEFDSAYQMFQFINYAFAEKEKDGYYRYIGSRMDGNNALGIATKEDDKFLKRMVSDPPSRNTAFIWQIRTLIEANAMAEAGSLIATLKKDPNFPERLNSSLEEVQAYWFYKQGMWDSSAHHLVQALNNAVNKQERARWEYLIAQLYDQKGRRVEAQEYYTKAINHTTDPVLDVYARLNLIRVHQSDNNDAYVDENIAELLKMAKREKYTDYRDIIYFMAARMELERNRSEAAQALLLRGAKYAVNPASRNRTYLQLGDLSYAERKYRFAASFYDSLQLGNDMLPLDAERVNNRKPILTMVVKHLTEINHQDSLQRIAAMPEDERTDYLKRLARQLRRQRGLKEEEGSTRATAPAKETDLFNTGNTKGEWYFYNDALKTKGASTFKQVWGNRPNSDNWRRASAVTAQFRNNPADNINDNPAGQEEDPNVITLESLQKNLPLTPEQLRVSNELISESLVALGKIYVNEVEDFPSAIAVYEDLRKRFPDYAHMNDPLFNLYYSYTKVGNTEEAAQIKKELEQKYPGSRQASIVNTGKDPQAKNANTEATRAYEKIYDLFIEGKFNEAVAAKKIADSIYKTHYWSPQLLYIEAVYQVKQREDSLAKNTLNLIVQQHPNTALASKAAALIDVLNRRAQIEEELNKLQIERPKEEEPVAVAETKPVVIEPVIEEPVISQVRRDTVAVQPNNVAVKPSTLPQPKQRTDTIAVKTAAPKTAAGYTFDMNAPQYVMVVLNKVDQVFGNEARNAFNRYHREKYYSLPLNTQLVNLDADNRLLLIGNFSSFMQAVEYLKKAKPIAATEIMPWLKADKYTFTVISESNLEVLKTKPDLNNYNKLLEQNTQVKF